MKSLLISLMVVVLGLTILLLVVGLKGCYEPEPLDLLEERGTR